MNLADAQTEFAARGFDYLEAGRRTTMLNAAKNAFEDFYPFPWLEGFQIGPAPLVIPDLKYILLTTADGRELWGSDIRQIVAGGNDLNETGTAEVWYLADQVGDAVTMRVWPVDTPTLRVIYVKRSPELVSGTDKPLIPERYHPLWLDLAVVQAYHDSDNFVGAQALLGEVSAQMLSVIESYETRNRQHSIPVTVHGYSEDE